MMATESDFILGDIINLTLRSKKDSFKHLTREDYSNLSDKIKKKFKDHSGAAKLQTLFRNKLNIKSIPIPVLIKYFKNIHIAPIEVPFPQTTSTHFSYEDENSDYYSTLLKMEENAAEYDEYVYNKMKILECGNHEGEVILYKQNSLKVYDKVTSVYSEKSNSYRTDSFIPFLYQVYCYPINQDMDYIYVVARWMSSAHTSHLAGRRDHELFLEIAKGKGKFIKRTNFDFSLVSKPTTDNTLMEYINDATVFSLLMDGPDGPDEFNGIG